MTLIWAEISYRADDPESHAFKDLALGGSVHNDGATIKGKAVCGRTYSIATTQAVLITNNDRCAPANACDACLNVARVA